MSLARPPCRHEEARGQPFCSQCSAPLAAACPACGTPHAPDQKFCAECGTPLAEAARPRGSRGPVAYTPRHLAERILTSKAALEGERKPVTVLFCDIVGSTALAARLGEDAMHRLL